MSPLLEIEHLSAELPVEGAYRTVLHDVSLTIDAGEALGLIGESGSGKSMTVRAVARLLPRGARTGGRIRFDGRDVLALKGPALRDLRAEVAMVFQDPRAHVNPVRTIGDFLTEALTTNGHVARAEARRRAISALAEVGIDDGARRLRQYPHELSGGLLQRVMIASALLIRPRLLLADEPTTALDVTTQAEVMAILDELRREHGLAVLFITHDLDLAAAVCDRMAVMYAGQIVESQSADGLSEHPRHPYSAALSLARPSIDAELTRLAAIPGRPLSAFEAPPGCSFATRCRFVQGRCEAEHPELEPRGDGLVRCLRVDELDARPPEVNGVG